MGGDGAATDTHYVEVAKEYEAAFFYESGAYQDWLLAQLLERLELGSNAARDLRVVDVGGGTGNFTAALAAAAGLTRPVLCVDNSAPMLAVAAGRAGITPREQDAATFAASTDGDATGYHRVLLKEIVHHVAADQVAPMYAGLARQLAPGGLCVTVTRPQEVDYPLWPAARAVWRAAQPPAERLAAQVAAAGLDVAVHEAVYTATLPKARWFAMVRARFWSTFAAFDDKGLEDGVALLEQEHKDVDFVTFNDRLIIIVGRKPDNVSRREVCCRDPRVTDRA